ncbi:MAG TPA: hypothetical protein VFJ16_22170 [Longimicrobium sp.]|nr:hypothetical protein [Longimicrobium sp.]
MRISTGMRAAVAALALAALVGACDRGGGSAAGGQGGAAAGQRTEQARADSVRDEQKALRDSGVSVDTQTVDTGGAAAPPSADN